MNKIIWFFGCSASGKETLIKYIYSGLNEKLNADLNIDLKNTIILEKSIEYISKCKDDFMTEKRFEIVEDVISLCKINDNLTILIKGQNSDIRNGFVETIKSQLLNAEIQLIYVTAETNVLIERVRNKEWYDITRGDDEYIASISRSLEYMNLFNDYNIIYVMSNPNFEYQIVSKKDLLLSKRI